MTLSLFSLGPLWTKAVAAGLLPPTIETYVGWERVAAGGTPLSAQGIMSRAQKLLFLCNTTVASQTIYVSADDALTWTAVTMPASMKWLYVAWTGTLYVAITAGVTSGANKLAYSKDGYSWVLVGSFSNIFRRVGIQTNGTGGYIIPGYNSSNYEYTLDGGFTWTTATAPSSPGGSSFYQFASDGQGTVIGVKSGGGTTYMRSLDSGVTFNLTTFPASFTADGTPTSVFWDSGIYWLKVAPTKFWVSNDGSNWVKVTIASSTGICYSFARGVLDYTNGKRSTTTDVSLPTAKTVYTEPLSSSTIQRDLNTETIYSFDYSSFVPFRSTKLTAHRATLNSLTGSDVGQAIQIASNGAGTLVALGSTTSPNGDRVYVSTDDGLTWTTYGPGVFANTHLDNVHWRGLVWDGTHFIAVADYYNTLPTYLKHYYSTDGITWTEGTTVGTATGFGARVIPRYGGGAIWLMTTSGGGAIPRILTNVTGSWVAATTSTYNSGSFNGWRDMAGDGAGNYVCVRKGDSTPNNPAIGWSADSTTWTFYEMSSGHADERFLGVVWDGNQWIIVGQPGGTGGNGVLILTSDKANPSSASDWSTALSISTGIGIADTGGYTCVVTDGKGRTVIFCTTMLLETVDGVTWNRREGVGYSIISQGVIASLGPKTDIDNRIEFRALDGTYKHIWLDTAQYPKIIFGETADGTMTGRAVSRRTEFNSAVSALSLSSAVNDIESLSTGSFTASTPIDLSFATTPTVPAKLRAVSTSSISSATGLTFNTTSGGSKYILASGAIVIDFSIPVSAFGFNITNAPRYSVTGSGSSTDRLTVIFTTAYGLTQKHTVPVYDLAANEGSVAFWGVIDPTRKFVSVRILPDNPGAASYGIDDIVVAIDTATAPAYDASLAANFTATPTSGNAPLTPQFEDTSGPLIPVAWWWDFNDDGYNERLDRISTPKYTFFEGTYNVRLMVKWTTGQFGTVVKPAYITANAVTPVASFTGAPVTGVAPLTVQFTDESSNFPTSWAWDFQNNGSTDSTLQHPSFTYSSAGTYDIKLTVSNGAGSHFLTRTAYVTATQPAPVASFTMSPASGAVPLTVNFTDTSTNTPTSWEWDFQNNGSTDSTTQNPSFTYTSAGTYTVKLTATNVGGSNFTTKTVVVSAGGSVGPMTFDVIPEDSDTYEYYNGGFDISSTVGPGPSYGVTWSAAYAHTNAGAHSASMVAGSSFAGEPIYMNFPAGFATDITFYIMTNASITIRTWDGAWGSGTLLTEVSGTYGSVSGSTMVQVTVPAGGLAKSVTWEDLTFGTTVIYLDDVVINL